MNTLAHVLVGLLLTLLVAGPVHAQRDAERGASPPSAEPGGDVTPGVVELELLEGGKARARALVVVLHGGSWDDLDHAELARRALEPVDDDARRLGLRVWAPVAPPSGDTTPWLAPAAEAALMARLDDELQHGRADERRIYLAGHGAGATGALHLAARHPDRFAAVALWSGTPSPLWDEHGELVGLFEDPVARLRGVPVWLWTGADDRWLDRETLALFTTGMQTRAEEDKAWQLEWVQGRGGHGYGSQGARPGLKFLKGHRKQRRPRASR